MKRHVLAFATTLAFGTAAVAQTNTPGIDKRQVNQQQRIDKGVASGKLNAKEAARLQQGQSRVQAAKDKAKADGKVTKTERKAISKQQNVQSKRIKKQKNDAQTAR